MLILEIQFISKTKFRNSFLDQFFHFNLLGISNLKTECSALIPGILENWFFNRKLAILATFSVILDWLSILEMYEKYHVNWRLSKSVYGVIITFICSYKLA